MNLKGPLLLCKHAVPAMQRGGRQGLLLPQVATEHEWDAEAFLAATCRKAGFATDAWRDPQTDILVFRAEVFGE